jgi:hypothetical protein
MGRTAIGLAGLLVVSAMLAACGHATPSPTGPADRFVAAISDPALKLTSAMAGTFMLTSTQDFAVYGVFTADGPSARIVVSIEGPLGITAWEQVVRDGSVTARRDVGGWSDPVRTADGTAQSRLPSALGSVRAARDLGMEERHGRSLHHVRAEGFTIADSAFGLEMSGGSGGATLEAWVGDDGTPAELHLGTPTLSLTLSPTVWGAAAPVGAPDELTTFRSTALKYAFVQPKSWVVSAAEGGGGHQIGLDGAFIVTYCIASTPRIGLDLWTREGIQYYGQRWHAQPDGQLAVLVKTAEGPLPGNIVTWHGTVEEHAAYILELAIVTEATTCDVQWFSPPGHETADRARFEQFLAGSRLGE